MNQKYLKLIVPTVLMLPVVFLFFVLKSRTLLPDNHPLMKIYQFNVTDAKSADMTRADRANYGGSEATFIKAKLFNDPYEYASMPLAQKAGSFFGQIPQKINEICLKADFSIKDATKKTFYKLINTKGTPAKLILIPTTKLSGMGALKNPVNWRKPKDFGIKGTFRYHFPVRISTPYGSVTYRAYLSNENKKLNTLMEKYMKSKGMTLLN